MPNHSSARPRATVLLLATLALLPASLLAQRATAALSLGLMIAAPRIPPASVVVPDVRGETLSGAAARMAVAGLVPRHAAWTPGNLDTSPVRRQWPRAGQRVPEGTVVALELANPLGALAPAGGAAAVRAAGEAALAQTPVAARLARTSLTAVSEARPGRGRHRTAAWWAFAPLLAVAAAAFLRPRRGRGGTASAAPLAGTMAPQPPSAGDAAARSVGMPLTALRLRTSRGAPQLAAIAPGAVAAGVGEAHP
jgi:PASTA domain